MDYFALTQISKFIYYDILKLIEYSFVSKAGVRKKVKHLRGTIMQAL
jgi:hypothetical protein